MANLATLANVYVVNNPNLLTLIEQLGALKIRIAVNKSIGCISKMKAYEHYSYQLVVNAADWLLDTESESCDPSILFKHYPEYIPAWEEGLKKAIKYKDVPF